MKQTGLKVHPMFHWTARRIEAHVKLCVLALQMQRAAENALSATMGAYRTSAGHVEGRALPMREPRYRSMHDNLC
jgi:transposase